MWLQSVLAEGSSTIAAQTPLPAQFLLALAAGLVAGLATVSGQLVAGRVNRSIARANHDSALRADRRDAIYAFIEAIQDAEEFLDVARRTKNIPSKDPGFSHAGFEKFGKGISDKSEIVHRIWFRQKVLQVVGTRYLENRSREYALKIQQVLEDRTPEGMTNWEFMEPEKTRFLEEAQRELIRKIKP